MYSFRRFAFVLACLTPAAYVAAQGPGSSSLTAGLNVAPELLIAEAAPAQQDIQAPPPAAQQSLGAQSVQARIRARREQRRVQAINDTYGHLYEVFIGAGYQRFTPGPDRQHATMYAFDMAVARYFNPRLAVQVEGRGNFGTAYVGTNDYSITRPSVSQYDVLVGPTYRLLLHPRYSVSVHGAGGVAMGNFTGDTNGFGTLCPVDGSKSCLLYSDGTTYAFDASIVGEWNLTPNVALRLAPDYMVTGFGSTVQSDRGATFGMVYRFGRQ